MTSSKATRDSLDVVNARGTLHSYLRVGQRVYVAVSRVSASGMTRWARVYVASPEQSISEITRLVAKVTELPYDSKHEAIRVEVAGIGAAHWVVSDLNHAMGGMSLIPEDL